MKLDNNLPVNILEDDIDKLSKKLYLESPDLWIDFTDKINSNVFDEMVLFFACKYNFISIIEHAINNNFIDLNSPSKNRSYSTIIQHLMSIATQNNNSNIYSYFKNLSIKKDTFVDCIAIDNKDKKEKISNKKVSEKIHNKSYDKFEEKNYFPKFICSKCISNIFESGFRVCESVEYKYLNKEKSNSEISRKILDTVTCCNCNTLLKDVTLEKLNRLCVIQNCGQCGTDLTNCGIIDKAKMVFNSKINKFTPSSTSYHCANCDNLINENQQDYFGL